jgi:hypothetical protein
VMVVGRIPQRQGVRAWKNIVLGILDLPGDSRGKW